MFNNKKNIIFIGIAILILFIVLVIILNKKTYYLELVGEKEIIVYQGSEYIESGFNAYDNKGTKYNDKVEVEGSVDTSIIGDYTITYKFKDKELKRIVSVIKDEVSNTYISLLGNKIIYIKKGNTYTEPGFIVFSDKYKDLEDKVTISGNVNTFVSGTYKLKYILNYNGINIETERVVVVLSGEYSISTSPESATNGQVTINLNIQDNYYDYVVMPNNIQSKERNITYTVSDNGIYTFVIYDKFDNKTEEKIEINNIDKISPTISKCTVSSNKVEVSATDNIKLDKYMIYSNNELIGETTDNQYNLNKTYTNVNVKVIDSAGNEANKECEIVSTIKVKINDMLKYINTSNIEKLQIVTFSNGKVHETYSSGTNDNEAMYISSASKTILGITAAKMQEDGIINLDTYAREYWYRVRNYNFKECSNNWQSYIGTESEFIKFLNADLFEKDSSIRNSLTHSSSIYNDNMVHFHPGDETTEYFGGGLSKTYMRAAFMLAHTSHQLFEKDGVPGTSTSYNYSSDDLTRDHALVGFTLQLSMKETIDEYLKSNILNKVNASSNPQFKLGNSEYFATTYQISAKDLAKVISAIANDGVYENTEIFKKETINELEKVESTLKNQTIAFDYKNGYYFKYGNYRYVSGASNYGVSDIVNKYNSYIIYNPNTSNGFIINIKFKNKKIDMLSTYEQIANYFYQS